MVLIFASALLLSACGEISRISPILAKASDGANLAKAHAIYRTSTGRTRVITAELIRDAGYPVNVHGFAAFLAQKVGQDLNNSERWLGYDDPLLEQYEGTVPSEILRNLTKAAEMHPDWESVPIGWSVAINIPGSVDATRYPLMWTRGLQPDGTWSEDSPFRGQGGHIVFLGGNVEWFKRLDASSSTDHLRRFSDGRPTANIYEALAGGKADALEWFPSP